MTNLNREVILWECENPDCENRGMVGIVRGTKNYCCPSCGRLAGHFAFVRKERLPEFHPGAMTNESARVLIERILLAPVSESDAALILAEIQVETIKNMTGMCDVYGCFGPVAVKYCKEHEEPPTCIQNPALLTYRA